MCWRCCSWRRPGEAHQPMVVDDLLFHSSRWQCQQARMVPEGYAMEWFLQDLTRTPHDTCKTTLPTPSSENQEKHLSLCEKVAGSCQNYSSFCRLLHHSNVVLVTDGLNHFMKLRVKWHLNSGITTETDGTISPCLASISWCSLGCVSARGIWVRWLLILVQIVSKKTSIHLEKTGCPPGSLRQERCKVIELKYLSFLLLDCCLLLLCYLHLFL